MSWLWGLIGATAASLIKPAGGITSNTSQTADSSLGGFDPASKLTFEETVAQMHRGYENTQRVVQFMDAKAGAVIAFSLTIFAFISKVVAWVYGLVGSGFLVSWETPGCCIHWTLTVLILAEVMLGGRCLHQAFMTIRPNALPMPQHFTTLFPACENAWNHDESKKYLENVVNGETRGFALGEFKQQLLAMGGIVFLKIQRLQRSLNALILQGLVALGIGAIIAILAGGGWIDGKSVTTAPIKPIAAPSASNPNPVASPP